MQDRETVALRDSEAAQHIADRRWPDGVRCPKCDSIDVAVRGARPERRWPQWRCRSCRRDFTVLTATEWSRTRLSPRAVLAAADNAKPDDAKPGVEHSEASRRMRRVVETELSAGTRKVASAMRARPLGATTAKIAELADMSTPQTRRALRDLSRRGWAAEHRGTVKDGHRLAPTALWALTYTSECIEALRHLPQHPAPMPAGTPDIVPPEFWHLFWSGTSGPELRISTDGTRIAGALIGSNDLSAEAWALRTLPLPVLEELRDARGFGSDDTASLIAYTIRHRSARRA